MKTTLLTLLLAFSSFVLISCNEKEKSPLLTQQIDLNKLVELSEQVENDKLLSLEEIQMLHSGINRLQGNRDTLAKMTVAEVIQSEKDLIRSSNINSFKANIQKINISLKQTFKLNQFTVYEQEGKKFDYVDIQIQNMSDKEITSTEGLLNIISGGQVLKTYMIQKKDPIAPNQTGQVQTLAEYDNASEMIFSLIQQKRQVIYKWQPILIEYSDGSRISIK